jgi:hypothetical protein
MDWGVHRVELEGSSPVLITSCQVPAGTWIDQSSETSCSKLAGVPVGAVGSQHGLTGRGRVHTGGETEAEAAEHDGGGAGDPAHGSHRVGGIGKRPGRAGRREDEYAEERELRAYEQPAEPAIGHRWPARIRVVRPAVLDRKARNVMAVCSVWAVMR